MKYCNKLDLFFRFGQSNIVAWSDIENNQDDEEINDRIEWSIEHASNEINERLSESPYQFPIENENIPLSIIKVCSEIAGILLYSSRRINDNENSLNELQAIQDGIEEYFRQVLGCKRILDLPKKENIPFVVKYDE